MLLTERDVAGILRKSLSYVQHLRSEGGGPRYLKIGASVRYRQDDVDSWLADLARTRVWEFDDKDTFEPVSDAADRVVGKLSRVLVPGFGADAG
jgi:predicted DNA-binding transcriptional regulator AlpA